MKNTSIAMVLLMLGLHIQGCEKTLIGTEKPDTVINNFELVWKTFDEHYGMFEVKNIDWQHQYDIYRPMLNENSSDADLYMVLSSMLKILNDNHVEFHTTDKNLPTFRSGILGNPPYEFQEDFDIDVVKQHYVTNLTEASNDISYGTIDNFNVGYILIFRAGESLSKTQNTIDEIIDKLKDTKGIIVDIRTHSGGFDYLGQYIAGKFASSKKLFMTSKRKNGPAHDDFTETLNWYVEPTGETQYLKPVILITSRFSTSAAETFALAMKQNENVEQLGDTTSGAFSDQISTEMYNGWVYQIAVGDYRAADGLSYEGIGLAPDYLIVASKTELDNGQDKPLEMAIDKLK